MKRAELNDFHDADVYQLAMARARRASTLNFVVEFGRNETSIVFDIGSEDARVLIESPQSVERPVRWLYGMIY